MGVSSIELADALSHSARHLAVAGVTRTMSSLAMGCHSASSQRVALRGSSLRPTRGASRPSKIVGTVVSVPVAAEPTTPRLAVAWWRGRQGLREPIRHVVRVRVRVRVRRPGVWWSQWAPLRRLPRPPPPPEARLGNPVSRRGGEGREDRRSTIAALGGAALLSYGLISNLFYVSSLLGAMYTACNLHAASPLVSKPAMQTFVTTYFGLWMIQNFLRPARMGLSVAISPQTDKIVEFFRRYVPGNRKPLAFGLTVFCINVLGTFAYMFGGFFLITAVTGVPIEASALKSLLAAGKAEVAKQGLAK